MATASKPLASGLEELEIDQKIIEPMIELGFADGKNIIEKGPGYYFDLLLEYDNRKLSKKESFQDYLHRTGQE